MNIKKVGNKIVLEIPYYSDRINPYMLDENGEPQDVGTYPTLTGLIIRHKTDSDYDELGFAHTLDMDYKDKDDQAGDFVIKWHGDKDKFMKKCKELGLKVYEFTI